MATYRRGNMVVKVLIWPSIILSILLTILLNIVF